MSVFSILCRSISVLCVIAAVKHFLCNIIWTAMHALFKLSDTLYFYNCIEIYGFFHFLYVFNPWACCYF